MKFFIKDLVTFTEETLIENIIFCEAMNLNSENPRKAI